MYGRQCFGSSDIMVAKGRAATDLCTWPCAFNGLFERCGISEMALYTLDLVPDTPTASDLWVNLSPTGFIGCFGDGQNRAMGKAVLQDSQMTVELCRQKAKHMGKCSCHTVVVMWGNAAGVVLNMF